MGNSVKLWLEAAHYVFICLLLTGAVSASVLPLVVVACRQRGINYISLFFKRKTSDISLLELLNSQIPCKNRLALEKIGRRGKEVF